MHHETFGIGCMYVCLCIHACVINTVLYSNIIFLCISKCDVCNLPGCVLVLAHAAGVRLLGSDTVQAVVSLMGDPGEHLERRGDPLIRVLLDSGSQQVTEKRSEYFCFTGMKVSPDTLQTVCSPLLLQGTEGFPESRADLIQQLNQRVAKDCGDCRFRVEVEGS